MLWDLGVGAHLLYRINDGPLTMEKVEAMADFCRFHLKPYFQRCAKFFEDENLDEMSPRRLEQRQKVVDQITPAKWSTYLAQWKVEQTDRSEAERRGCHAYTIEKARAGEERMGVSEDDSERLRSILSNTRAQYTEAYRPKYKFGGD